MKKLAFDSKYDEEFNVLIEKHKNVNLENVVFGEDFRLNLLIALYKCENISQRYSNEGIPERVLLDTLKDVVIWSDTFYNYSGYLGLEETHWLVRHFDFKIFRLGRLQFEFGKSECTDQEVGVTEGENVLNIHIPKGNSLTEERCDASFALANEFFAKFFPDYKYNFYVCYSWLLDKTLNRFLPEESNIIKFGNRFKILKEEELEAAIRFTFGWKMTKEKLYNAECRSGLEKCIKDYVLNGGTFYESYGIIKHTHCS